MKPETINQQLKAAAAEGDLDEVKRLIEAGADVDYHGDAPPQSPLMDAYFNNHKEVIEYLLANGANIDHDEFEEGTVLTFSAFGGDVDWIEYLLDLGADINHPMPIGGETALHHAADKDRVEAARALVRRGGDVNLKAKEGESQLNFGNFAGETPLHVAAVRSGTEFIRVLLDGGADKSIMTLDGKTAYDCAVEYDRPEEITRLLRQD